ncbi:MAG: helix-turn-helix transcriptional regulator [Minwuia sp.]|nr:helix-turn-helix transcriptional regulator [Minwuia sp.]
MQHLRHIDRHVGERIRSRRAELGMTQHDLASLLGISYQQVQKYETGANRVSAGRLYEVARQLGSSVGFFFEGLEGEASQTVTELAHGGTNRTTIDLARNFGRLDNNSIRGAISTLVRALADEANEEDDSIRGAGHKSTPVTRIAQAAE